MNTAQPAAPRPAFDLAAWWSALWQPWRELHLWPPFAWLSPQPAVRVLHLDGSESLWAGGYRAANGSAAESARHVAVELPESLRLECRLQLPALPGSQLHDAVALQVRSASPFEPDDLVWGYRTEAGSGGQVQALALLASRRSVARHLEALADRLGAAAQPEVWASDSAGQMVVLQGFGEPARQRAVARGRWRAYGLLATAGALAVAAALTPTVQLKWRAMQAAQAGQQLERQMAPLLAQREQLVRAQGEIEALRGVMGEQVEALAVVELLTRLIPDDTWLQRLQVQGSKVTVSGQTPNAAALMNQLSSHPGVRDVKAPAAATRSMQGGRENFTVEWTLAPELLRPSLAGPKDAVKP